VLRRPRLLETNVAEHDVVSCLLGAGLARDGVAARRRRLLDA
jgi:hypothetical protein